MSPIRQIQANRLNAQKSTGPRSLEGKAAVRMNALKSGIDAQSTIIRGENPADFEALTNEYLAAHSPVTPQERFYVDILIRSDWQMRRLTRADAQIWEYRYQGFSTVPEDCPLGKIYACTDQTFARLQRRMKDVEHSYKDAAQELARLQSTRAAEPAPELEPDSGPSPQPLATEFTYPEIGFVPSARATSRPNEVPARRSQPPTVPTSIQASPSVLPVLPAPASNPPSSGSIMDSRRELRAPATLLCLPRELR